MALLDLVEGAFGPPATCVVVDADLENCRLLEFLSSCCHKVLLILDGVRLPDNDDDDLMKMMMMMMLMMW